MVWIIISAAVAVVVIILLVISNKVFNVAVKAKVTKEKVFETNAEVRKPDGREVAMLDRDWLAKQAFDEHIIVSFDKLKLFGRILYAPQPSVKWVVIAHGFSGNGLKMGIYARHFHEQGWNVLLPDLRGCGNSEGKYMGMGWLDAKDMLRWFDVIIQADAQAEILMCGGSMGGATTMMVTGYSLPPNVKVAVEDCGYTSVWEEFTFQLKKVFGLPQFPFMYIVDAMAKHRAGYTFREASSIRQLEKSNTPTLFIHGMEDEFVPYFMLEQNYEAAVCEKQKLSVPGAGHGTSVEVSPKLYWDTVDAFVGKYM